MPKAYDFMVVANRSEKCGEMIFTMPMDTIYRDTFKGTVNELASHIQSVKDKLAKENQFDTGKGFSVSCFLTGNQRKPAGWSSKIRFQLSTNFIA